MLPQPPILLITDRDQAAVSLTDAVAGALAGGCRWISLREKDLTGAERAALLAELLPPVRANGAVLTVHDDLEAAEQCNGLHLPAGGDVQAARARLGPGKLIGLSCHSLAEVRAARGAGADYVTLSPIFLTASKPGYGPALGLRVLTQAAGFGIPVLALAGVDAGNAAACRHAGAAGIAVMGGIMRSHDPAGEMHRLIAAWQS